MAKRVLSAPPSEWPVMATGIWLTSPLLACVAANTVRCAMISSRTASYELKNPACTLPEPTGALMRHESRFSSQFSKV